MGLSVARANANSYSERLTWCKGGFKVADDLAKEGRGLGLDGVNATELKKDGSVKTSEHKGGHDHHEIGNGGELHQVAGGTHPPMTSQHGFVITDDENSLKVGERGPVLYEDHLLFEKTQHFDHERIPERVVHARGYGAKGFFELTESLKGVSKAGIFNRVGEKTPVFVRFSTVAGNMGSTDLARDVLGPAAQFYRPMHAGDDDDDASQGGHSYHSLT